VHAEWKGKFQDAGAYEARKPPLLGFLD
jgi:hypothetical protein